MTSTSARDLVTALAASFGDPERIVALLAPDVQWWITPTVGVVGSPTVGRDAVAASMQIVFGQMYADVRTRVHHVIADDRIGAARFTMTATALVAGGRPYENEYCLWVEVADGRISRVWEYLDVAHAAAQFGP